MDGSTVRGNLKEQIFGIGKSCIHIIPLYEDKIMDTLVENTNDHNI